MYPFERNCLKLCLEFLFELTTYETETANIDTDMLRNIFASVQNLSSYNIRSIVLVLCKMMENVVTLFSAKNLADKPRKFTGPVVENPPLPNMLPNPLYLEPS